jgi:hypothetical protein
MRKVTAEALKYVAGYVAFKLKGQYPDLGVVSSKVINEQTVCSSSWINALSRGGLRQPSAAWFQSIQNLEKEFNRHHGTDLSKESGVIKKLVDKLAVSPSVPQTAIACFIKTRTFILWYSSPGHNSYCCITS